jgi:hypothetical protein
MPTSALAGLELAASLSPLGRGFGPGVQARYHVARMRNLAWLDETDPAGGLPEGDEAGDARGWEGLAEWTGGLAPEQVEELAAVRELEAVYPLLHALVGRSPREFFVRAAVMEALVQSARAAFSAADLEEILYWLAEPARSNSLRALRQSGWLEFDPTAGHTLTDSGRWVGDVLSFLHRRLRESELLPTLEGVRYALDIGLDPLRHLQSMRSRLAALRHEIDEALASHSEVVLRRTAEKLQEVLRLSARIRAVLDAVGLDQVAARRVAREIHDLLSRLHGAETFLASGADAAIVGGGAERRFRADPGNE